MKFKVMHMYNRILDLYGDKGNMQSLRYRCQKRGIKFEYAGCDLNEKIDNLSDYNLVFLGGGADFEQSVVAKDLIKRKNQIVEAMNSGTFFLLICGGYQLFGRHYIDAKGNKIDGLGIFDYYTEAAKNNNRCIGNVIIEAKLTGELNPQKIIGFENHGGQTFNVESPFGKVIHGNGNFFKSDYEGVHINNLIGTYLHGPLLPKNPILTDYIIRKGMKNLETLEPIDDTLEVQAFRSMESRL